MAFAEQDRTHFHLTIKQQLLMQQRLKISREMYGETSIRLLASFYS